MEKILVETRGDFRIVILNRPDQLNCFDYDMLLQLEKVLKDIQLDLNIRAVIFTGSGDKAFSAGADLKERELLSESQVRRNVLKIREVFNLIEDLPQPTIAAINGYALGGGFELALACDFRIASENAIIGLTEVSWAIIPGAGGTQRLPQLIGISLAKELILTARKITSLQAKEYGLLTSISSSEIVLEQSIKLSEEISKNGPLAVIKAKYAINQGSKVNMSAGLEIEAQAYNTIIPTNDRLEALRAFKEKRVPQFKGR